MDDLTDNVQVTFLPPNTTRLIQPTDKGVIAAFKAYYLRCTFKQMIKFLGGKAKPTVREFWHDYHTMNAIDSLAEAWQEVKTTTVNLCLA